MGSQTVIASKWLKLLEKVPASEQHIPSQIYDGVGFRRAHALATELTAPLFVASAGLGLISEKTLIPSYDLTLTRGYESSIADRVKDEFDPAEWWSSMQNSLLARSMSAIGKGDGRIVVALTQPYLQLVGTALGKLPAQTRSRLRILGMNPLAQLPEKLHPQVIAYDYRLDALLPGTRHDSWSRVMTHFVGLVTNKKMTTVESDQAAVNKALLPFTAPEMIKRPRATDELILKHVEDLSAKGHSASSALRYLRDVEKVACEERRFRRLFEEQAA